MWWCVVKLEVAKLLATSEAGSGMQLPVILDTGTASAPSVVELGNPGNDTAASNRG